MEKITLGHPLSQSEDLVKQNLETLKLLFPTIVKEGRIDFKELKSLLGEEMEMEEEYYRFTWAGKSMARREANKPSTATLRPSKKESKDWDTTGNIFIEGDNLEVLKLLQKSYADRVKMIYIDPPYNTGKDFVYKDNYNDNLSNYLSITGQIDATGNRVSTNTESDGRYHSNWLNMMYPRLRLARNLLREDGVIFISLDDNEIQNLRRLCDEIFGEENFIVNILWKKRSTPPNDKIIGANHDYILCYCKNIKNVILNLRERNEEQIARYRNPDNHRKGPWTPGDLMANVKGGRYVESLHYPIINPKTGESHFPSSKGNWRFNKEKIQNLIANDEIYFGEDGNGRPKLKRFLSDVKEGITYPSIWDFVPLNTDGSKEIADLLGNQTIFDNPKPVGLLTELINLGSGNDDLIMDFFAGSGSTAHAVMKINSTDGSRRKFICIQLPEATENSSEAYKVGFKNITDITKARIKRAAEKLTAKRTTEMFDQIDVDIDLGFRTFKLDSSNIKSWEGKPENLDITLFDSAVNIRENRSEHDVLFEILLKYGLELTVPMEERSIANTPVFNIGSGALFICLSDNITTDVAEGIGKWKEELQPAVCQVIFKDTGFTDVEKTNSFQILKRYGINEVNTI